MTTLRKLFVTFFILTFLHDALPISMKRELEPSKPSQPDQESHELSLALTHHVLDENLVPDLVQYILQLQLILRVHGKLPGDLVQDIAQNCTNPETLNAAIKTLLESC